MNKLYELTPLLKLGIYALLSVSLFSLFLSVYVDYYKVSNELILRVRSWVYWITIYSPILVCLLLFMIKKGRS